MANAPAKEWFRQSRAMWGTPMAPSEKLVLLCLHAHADQEGRSWPTVPAIVRETGLGRSTVVRSLTWLEKNGFVNKTIHGHTGGGWNREYVINYDAMEGVKQSAHSEHVAADQSAHSGHVDTPTRVPTVAYQSAHSDTSPLYRGTPQELPKKTNAEKKRALASLVDKTWRQVVERYRAQSIEPQRLTGELRKNIGTLLGRYGAESILKVVNWQFSSSHDRAEFLRSRGCSQRTLFKPDNFAEYVSFARSNGKPAGANGVDLANDPQATKELVESLQREGPSS